MQSFLKFETSFSFKVFYYYPKVSLIKLFYLLVTNTHINDAIKNAKNKGININLKK